MELELTHLNSYFGSTLDDCRILDNSLSGCFCFYFSKMSYYSSYLYEGKVKEINDKKAFKL